MWYTFERWVCSGLLRGVVMRVARDDDRILLSADTDFGALLARSRASSPSVVLVRRVAGRRVPDLAALLVANLPTIEEDLLAGSVVAIGEDSLRVRRLPLV
jgi:predicted nuclease of predicted toxin-antitoxin system